MEHQLNSQPTAQKLVTTQLQLLRLISKTCLLCWQPDVNRLPRELGVTLTKNCPSTWVTDVTALNCYPLIRKLYIELNTGLPASAAVERLFSLGEKFSLLCDLSLAVNVVHAFVKLWIAAAETLVSLVNCCSWDTGFIRKQQLELSLHCDFG